MDHRSHQWLQQQGVKRGTDHPATCMCGELAPTRRHWLWDCPALPHPPATTPDADSVEHALGVPHHLRPPASPPLRIGVHASLVAAIDCLQTRNPHSPVLLASDGGVKDPTRPRYRAGAFAVAVEQPDAPPTTIRRWLGGMDQTFFAAELHGAIVALESAYSAGIRAPLQLIIDNKSVQQGVNARFQGFRPVVQYYGKLWRRVEHLAALLPAGSKCNWVPAHGKHLDWMPDTDRDDGLRWRRLNDAADDAASAEAQARWNETMLPQVQAEIVARARAACALQRLLVAEKAWTDKWF